MAKNQLISIRGATTINSNTVEEIKKNTLELIKELINVNNLDKKDVSVINIMCSTTSDITAYYPVKEIRESNLLDAPLFSCIEPDIDGGLKLCIRLMLTVTNSSKSCIQAKHVYLNGAKTLRPDLLKD